MSAPDVSTRRRKRRAQTKGRQVVPQALSEVQALLGDRPRQADMLLEYMHLVQDRYHQLSAAHLAALGQELNLPMMRVYEVATFYHHLDVVKEGGQALPPLTVRVCDSMTCAMRGAVELAEALEGAVDKQQVRIQRVSCVGRCAEAPVAVVGQRPVLHADPRSVLDLVAQNSIKPEGLQPVHYADYRKQGGYQTYLACRQGDRTADSVIKALDDSALRGLGGAGFPVGRKWRLVRAEPAPRYLALNIDEGEPGTFKDRYFLERDPHRTLEGVLIAAWAVGIERIYIYLRDEYPACYRMLIEEMEAMRADLPKPLPELILRRGAGAYICGEESAMIESIEGKHGYPRLRPPYVSTKGLFGRPTLEHNLESLHWVRDILEKGAAWFADQGRHGRKGVRAFSVSGRVKKPGVYVAPAGITLNELISEYCDGMADGHELYGYFPGGASGGILPASLADVPLDFDTLKPYGCFIGSAGIVVFSHQDRARDLAQNAMRFFAHESCGQCTPCRVGTTKASHLMQAEHWDQPLLEDLSKVMASASICGLGQAAPNPIRSVTRYFPEEVN